MILKVLICDDAGFIREIFNQAVLESGHEVVGLAKDGVEVIQMARQHKPDLVLMDLVLPLKNGAEAAADIKRELPGTYIVALSTVDASYLAQKSQDAGCEGFLVKPFTKAQLKKIFTHCSQRHQEVGHGRTEVRR